MPAKSPTRVAIIFGGKSVEHEVSVSSARNIVAAIDRTIFTVTLIGINHAGQWGIYDPDELQNTTCRTVEELQPTAQAFTPFSAKGIFKITPPIDVVFPVLHGFGGEDGTMQGLLTLANVSFVGPSVLGSALAMNKIVAKKLLRAAGLPITPFASFTAAQKSSIDFAALTKTLGSPIFVKPASLGSSVGVSKVQTAAEFAAAVDSAFSYDYNILIETAITGQEVECAVLGNDDPKASEPGSLIAKQGFYSYDAKYTDPEGATFAIPANISATTRRHIQTMALQAFASLECQGMARVDFFVTPDEEIFINEVNTIPGFTPISMYPKLWEYSGLPTPQLITKLIELAQERSQKMQKLQHTLVI